MPPCPAAASAGAPCASGGSSCWTRDTPQHGQHQRVRGQQLPGVAGLQGVPADGAALLRQGCPAGADPERIPAPAVHRPGSETGAGLSADQAVHLHRIAGPRAGTGDGGGGGRGGPAPPGEAMPQRLPECLRRELLDYARRRGDLLRPHLCHPHRPPLRPGQVSVSIRRLCRDAQVPRKRATRGACGSCITPPERRSRPLWPSWWSRPMSACWRRNRPPSAGAAVRR